MTSWSRAAASVVASRRMSARICATSGGGRNQACRLCGPLSIHQFSHIWIDFRGIQDDYMRDRRIDYFENSRRATYVHQQYAIANPDQYDAYGENSWGLTATDGPGPGTYMMRK